MRDRQFRTVASFLPAEADALLIREIGHMAGVKAFESYLRGSKTGSRAVAMSCIDCAQRELERLSLLVGAMQDCLRHHRSELPAGCCRGECTTARCVDGREFEIPADACVIIDGEVS